MLIGNRDRLQRHRAVRFDQPAAAAEKVSRKLCPTASISFDRDELVEASAQLTIVFQEAA